MGVGKSDEGGDFDLDEGGEKVAETVRFVMPVIYMFYRVVLACSSRLRVKCR